MTKPSLTSTYGSVNNVSSPKSLSANRIARPSDGIPFTREDSEGLTVCHSLFFVADNTALLSLDVSVENLQFDEGSTCEPEGARSKALIRAAYKTMGEYVHVDR